MIDYCIVVLIAIETHFRMQNYGLELTIFWVIQSLYYLVTGGLIDSFIEFFIAQFLLFMFVVAGMDLAFRQGMGMIRLFMGRTEEVLTDKNCREYIGTLIKYNNALTIKSLLALVVTGFYMLGFELTVESTGLVVAVFIAVVGVILGSFVELIAYRSEILHFEEKRYGFRSKSFVNYAMVHKFIVTLAVLLFQFVRYIPMYPAGLDGLFVNYIAAIFIFLYGVVYRVISSSSSSQQQPISAMAQQISSQFN